MFTATSLISSVAFLLALPSAKAYTPEALADQVRHLPGLTYVPNFNHFSGYLPVQDATGRQLHYWFVESQNDPSNDPVVMWTNGGPGCSGLLGFLSEQGPFRPNPKLELDENPHSWNKIANVLFMETPAGVGYSYSADPTDRNRSDEQTARDNLAALLQFSTRFPEFSGNDFYISSESWGGHYMPTLAKEIVDANTAAVAAGTHVIPFKGFLVGNPYTDANENVLGTFDTLHGHQLVSESVYSSWATLCRPLYLNAMQQRLPLADTSSVAGCSEWESTMYAQFGNLNPYALDYPVCLQDDDQYDDEIADDFYYDDATTQELEEAEFSEFSALHAARGSEEALAARRLSSPALIGQRWRARQMQSRARAAAAASRRRGGSSSASLRGGVQEVMSPLYDPCVTDYLFQWINQQDVKAALHVRPDLKWGQCSSHIKWRASDSDTPMEPIYNYLIDGGFNLKILVYSGDDDDVCGTAGTALWIPTLGYELLSDWQVWTDSNGQVGGYVTKYAGFSYVTVHGAGHEVPTYQPVRALDLFKSFLSGEW